MNVLTTPRCGAGLWWQKNKIKFFTCKGPFYVENEKKNQLMKKWWNNLKNKKIDNFGVSRCNFDTNVKLKKLKVQKKIEKQRKNKNF